MRFHEESASTAWWDNGQQDGMKKYQGWGTRGRRFKSSRSDHFKLKIRKSYRKANCAFSKHDPNCTRSTPALQTIHPKVCHLNDVGGVAISQLATMKSGSCMHLHAGTVGNRTRREMRNAGLQA